MPDVHPDWLGSPQHVAGGFVLALVVCAIARWRGLPLALTLLLGVSVSALCELLLELAEYPLLYAGAPHVSAYFDTLADLAATLAGAVLGSGVFAVFVSR